MPLVSKWMHNFWKSWFFLKRWWWWFFFLFSFFFGKWTRHGQMPLVCELMHDFLKTLIFEEKMIFFFLMDEAWPNAPSSTINVNFENSYCVGTFNKKKQFEWNKIKITKLGKTRTARMVVASKLKIDGDCWINEWSMSTSFKRFFPWAC